MSNHKSLFPLQIIRALRENKQKIKVEGLKGPAVALFTAFADKEIKNNLLIITPTPSEAERFYTDQLFFLRDHPVYLFPTKEILPYEELDIDPFLTSKRINALHALLYKEGIIVVSSVRAIMDRIIPRYAFNKSIGYYGLGETVARQTIVRQLIESGYRSVPLVEGIGEFSVRGAILDIFPLGWDQGCRLEFFGDEIESIRRFDTKTQRSMENQEEVIILPVKEVILNQDRSKRMTRRLERAFSKSILYQSQIRRICERIERLEAFPGIDFYVPFLYEHTETIFAYISQKGLLCLLDPERVLQEAKIYEDEINSRFHKSKMHNHPYPSPDDTFISHEKLEQYIKAYQRILFFPFKSPEAKKGGDPVFPYNQRETSILLLKEKADVQKRGVFTAITKRLKTWQTEGKRVILTCLNEGQAERLRKMLDEYGIGSRILNTFPLEDLQQGAEGLIPISICLGDLSAGISLDFLDLVLITHEEIFGEKRRVSPLRIYRGAKALSDFNDLKVNDYIVHMEHGIGLYKGLIKLEIDAKIRDFLLLEFRDGDKLYCPPENLELIQKYIGSGDSAPPLDRLGGKHWANLKARVKKSIEDMAVDLLHLYAGRQMAKGFAFSTDNSWEMEFEEAFEYEETPDQIRAIQEVKKDMEKDIPMDRLVCGDVGYGKTEVAMRAAFKGAMSGKQVAMLAPTTVLVQQHFQKFSARMSSYPIKVEMLSRFIDHKDQKKILEGLEKGEVDIVIGTHKLLQKDVRFKDLGLIIIDEEHRFGVRHKERLKKLRKEVDCLALTATPIPRTLYMSTIGIRDMSIIDTPPLDRLPIITYITHFDPELIQEACQREIDRGGQVFYVYNKVEGIEEAANFIHRLLPHARVAIGHGQLPEKELEKIMLDFFHQKYDILICTTIIESGLDISSANTIIINHGERFGLAQLYQLRGRVGRSSHRAYAYLLIPSEASLTDEAKKRLSAIQEFAELGSGYRLASRDMEIRGAGNLFGSQQHGHIAAVGFDLYCELIKETIAQLRGEPVERPKKIELNLNIDAFITENYIPDVNQKLNVYKRVSLIEDKESLAAIYEELRDRYGPLPQPAENLLKLIDIKIIAKTLGIDKLEGNEKRLLINFSSEAPLKIEKLLKIIMDNKERFKLIPPGALEVRLNKGDSGSFFEQIKSVFSLISKTCEIQQF